MTTQSSVFITPQLFQVLRSPTQADTITVFDQRVLNAMTPADAAEASIQRFSIREICHVIGFRSVGAVQTAVKRLSKQGIVEQYRPKM